MNAKLPFGDLMSVDYDLDGREIIVVGGAGYIGSHVCKMIARHGGRPVTFDNLSSGHEHAVKWGPLADVVLLCKVRALVLCLIIELRQPMSRAVIILTRTSSSF